MWCTGIQQRTPPLLHSSTPQSLHLSASTPFLHLSNFFCVDTHGKEASFPLCRCLLNDANDRVQVPTARFAKPSQKCQCLLDEDEHRSSGDTALLGMSRAEVLEHFLLSVSLCRLEHVPSQPQSRAVVFVCPSDSWVAGCKHVLNECASCKMSVLLQLFFQNSNSTRTNRHSLSTLSHHTHDYGEATFFRCLDT